jgi:superfamily II DNA or RNA helicase
MEAPVHAEADLNAFEEGLYAYQRPCVRAQVEMLQRRNVILNASDPGVGKTVMTCVIARRLGWSLFVISPKGVIEPWFTTAVMTGCNLLGVVNYESAKVMKYYTTRDEFFAQVKKECPFIERDEPNKTWHWHLPPRTLLVFDEAHRGKNRNTGVQKLMESSKEAVPASKIILLSATITDRLNNFHPTAYLLGVAQWAPAAYRAWLNHIKQDNETFEQAIHRVLFTGPNACAVRIRVSDIQRDPAMRDLFKQSHIHAQTFEMSAEVNDEIERNHHEIAAAMDALRQGYDPARDDNPFTMILRARQRNELLKCPRMALEIQQALMNDKSVLVGVNFRETAQRLFELIDPFVQQDHRSFVSFIHGGQTPADRQYQIDSFRNDASRVMIANVQSAGEGLSLDDRTIGRYARMAFLFPPWSSILTKQFIFRLLRAGALLPSEIVVFYARGPLKSVPDEPQPGLTGEFQSKLGIGKVGVEELIAETINEKLQTLEWLINGDDDDLTRF